MFVLENKLEKTLNCVFLQCSFIMKCTKAVDISHLTWDEDRLREPTFTARPISFTHLLTPEANWYLLITDNDSDQTRSTHKSKVCFEVISHKASPIKSMQFHFCYSLTNKAGSRTIFIFLGNLQPRPCLFSFFFFINAAGDLFSTIILFSFFPDQIRALKTHWCSVFYKEKK